MIKLEINQNTTAAEEQLSPKLIMSIAQAINQHTNHKYEGEIAVAFVPDDEIRRLNRQYRQQDKITDVLSFSYLQDPRRGQTLGDVAISLPQVRRQARGRVREELVDLIVHGALHILGYDHEEPDDAKQMFTLQDKIVSLCL